MNASQHWTNEDWRCEALEARTVDVPDVGESEAVSVADVMARRVWFPVGGIYIIRHALTGQVQYIGRTTLPLRVCLFSTITNGLSWSVAYPATPLTVSLQRAPEYPDVLRVEWMLAQRYKPVYNGKRGRPRKARGEVHAGVKSAVALSCSPDGGGDDAQ